MPATAPFRVGQVPTPATPAAAMPPAMPAPAPAGAGGGAMAPAQGPPPSGAQKPSEGPAPGPQQREQQVREVIQSLIQTIVQLGQTIYEISLTDFQVSDIAERILETFSDAVNDITVDRVKEIGMGLIGGEETRQRSKK